MSEEKATYATNSLNALAAEIHETTISHGFWEGLGPSVHHLILPLKVALIHSKVSEALEADRSILGEPAHTDAVAEELVDVIIRTLDLLAWMDVDVQGELLRKMSKNKVRPFRHGNKKY